MTATATGLTAPSFARLVTVLTGCMYRTRPEWAVELL